MKKVFFLYASTLFNLTYAILSWLLDQKALGNGFKDSAVDSEVVFNEDGGHRSPYFESAEHRSIGDSILLQYDSESIYGTDFAYQAGSQKLSFGYVVALAGDFYGNWDTLSTGCVEQISDAWNSAPERSVKLFLSIAEKLSSDSGGYLKCIIKTMKAQEADVVNGINQGQDPAQVYKSISGSYDTKYGLCTNLGYAWIALCNWDHFGIDAVNAYSAGHTAALRQAQIAYKSKSYSDLKQAYFLEGFALHYLTDLFSTGHMREPRRILHKTYLGAPDQPGLPDIELYPADLCAQKQHDEDCANGLWVQNRLGESWPAYGDKQLFTGKSAKNFKQAVSASQSGILEIWNTYKTGIAPSVANFEALKRIPILENINQPPNFAPLFRWNSSDPNSLYLRKDLNQRSGPNVTTLSASMSILQWNSLLSQIKTSPQDINMYPFSQSFNSTANTVHFRQLSQSRFAINLYGPVDPAPRWNMYSQSLVTVPENPGTTKWISASKIGTYGNLDVYSLIGLTTSPNKGPITSTHNGFTISADDAEIQSIWSDDFEDGNDFWTLVDTVYGIFLHGSSDITMLKYWINGPRSATKFETYTIPADFSTGPTRVSMQWPIVPLNTMFPYRVQPNDYFDFLVTIAYNVKNKQIVWNFTSFDQSYSKKNVYNFITATAFPAQTVLTGVVGSDSPNTSIIQLYYGATFPVPNYVRIDVLQPVKTSSGQIILPNPATSQQFPAPWPAHQSSEYLTWFFSDVNGDGVNDLVTYTSSSMNTTLTVIVFPGQVSGGFAAPIVSSITVSSSKGTLFTSSFMHPVYTRQAAFSYPPRSQYEGIAESTEAGILSFFDNYGILGVRMVAPVTATGTFAYEFKGQTPAIAGQLSGGLGWKPPNQMNRGESGEAIGFLQSVG